MARILILEPQPEIRELVAHVVTRLGHVALTQPPDHDDIDAIVLEPESLHGLALAHQLHARFPELPIVCESIAPPGPRTSDLNPAAYLLKPFGLDELERVLVDALAAASSDAA